MYDFKLSSVSQTDRTYRGEIKVYLVRIGQVEYEGEMEERIIREQLVETIPFRIHADSFDGMLTQVQSIFDEKYAR